MRHAGHADVLFEIARDELRAVVEYVAVEMLLVDADAATEEADMDWQLETTT